MSERDASAASRRFVLNRLSDPTGISGTGVVADGVLFPNGKVAVSWRGRWTTVTVHESMDSVEAVHGHVGETQIFWLDD